LGGPEKKPVRPRGDRIGHGFICLRIFPHRRRFVQQRSRNWRWPKRVTVFWSRGIPRVDSRRTGCDDLRLHVPQRDRVDYGRCSAVIVSAAENADEIGLLQSQARDEQVMLQFVGGRRRHRSTMTAAWMTRRSFNE